MSGKSSFENQVPEGLACGFFIYRSEGEQNILYADSNVVHLFGCDRYDEFLEYIGNSFPNMVHPDDRKKAEHSINAQTVESGHRHDYLRYRIITKQGEIRYIEDFGHIVYDGEGRGYYYVFIVSVTEQEYRSEYFNSFAEGQVAAMNWKIDPLTGLKNIVAFREELDNAVRTHNNRLCTVTVFDIIGLKHINRTAGRGLGDRLIRSLVQAIHEQMPESSLVYRGYDADIIVVCPDASEKDVIERINRTAQACPSQVFFGVASTADSAINAGNEAKHITILQALEEAHYDLSVKKILNEKSVRSQALTAFVRALQEADQDTEEHVMRTRSMGIALGKRLGLSDAQLTSLELMCLLHDIGKIAIPLDILNKPGKLTENEWAVLRTHPDKGYQIAQSSDMLRPIAECIRYHHERWDGKGYPAGLSGEAIPMLSRIISIVDAYDAMVNDRCYRKALPPEHAKKEIADNAGTQFDPRMAAEFLRLLEENPELARGDKTGADEIRVFKRTRKLAAHAGNTQPVVYCEYKLDVDERIIEAGQNFEAVTGYSPAEALGKMTQYDLIPPDDLEDYLVHLGNQFAHSNTAYLRHRIRRKDGSIISVLCHGMRQFDSATRSFQSTVHIYEDAAEEKRGRRAQFRAEDSGRTSSETAFRHFAHALSRDYTDLYYVNMQTDEFIEYHTDEESGALRMVRRGEQFFEGIDYEAEYGVHKDDKPAFVRAMNREFLGKLDCRKVFRLTYRRLKEGRQFYVEMKVSRMPDDERIIVIAVSDIDELMHKRFEQKRIEEERIIYARLHAITGNFICVYVVDPQSGEYREFSATDRYENLGQAKSGAHFFDKVREVALIYNHSDDLGRFLSLFTRENVLKEIERSGMFSMTYRLLMNDKFVYVQMKAALVEEKEGTRLIVGLNDVDAQVRQQLEVGRKLQQAQSQASRDGLTGVKNKRAFDEAVSIINRQISERIQKPFAAVMFDVNDLKIVNDTKGHQAGDELLRSACRFICETFKHSPVFRIGGDEFTVISQGADREHIDELIALVEEHNQEALRSGDFTIACGMSKLDGDERFEDVFRRADHAMYENKRKLKKGRD